MVDVKKYYNAVSQAVKEQIDVLDLSKNNGTSNIDEEI
jgi:hypothetical protein